MRFFRAVLSYSILAVLTIQLAATGFSLQEAHAANGDLIINEINWAGSHNNPSDQWIELYDNQAVGSTPIDFAVTPYTLTIEDATNTVLQAVSLSNGVPVLLPGQYLLIHNTVANTTLQASAPMEQNYVPATPLISLPHVATQYILTDSTNTEVDALKAASAQSAIPFAGSDATATAPVASMERVYTSGIPGVGTSQASWDTSMTRGAYFTSGTTQYGTPGEENIAVAAPSNVAISPADSVTSPTNPTITGTVGGTATSVTLSINRQGPVPQTVTMVTPVVSGAFSVMPPLNPGRYTFQVVAEDAVGNQSPQVDVPVAAGSLETNYIVFATVSTVASPVVTGLPSVTNQATVDIAGTTAAAVVQVDILRNGEYQATLPVSGGTFAGTAFLIPNSVNTFAFIAVDGNGVVSLPANYSVTEDNIAPNAVDATKVVVASNPPGTADAISGLAGAAEAGTKLSVYGNSALTVLIGTVTVAADGSFPMVSIGDNLYGKVYLRLMDTAGNLSSVTVINNTIGFSNPAGGIGLTLGSVTQTQAAFTWQPVPGAVNYKVAYRLSNAPYTVSNTTCAASSTSCATGVTLINLTPGSSYVVAVDAVDQYGNETPYTELAFQTLQPVVTTTVASTDTTTTPAVTTAVAPTPAQGNSVAATPTPSATATPTPTPTPTATPEAGQVKSAATTATGTNWTPWIVLAVLLAIAILATLGYFYWFGGEAGEMALGSVEETKSKIDTEIASKKATDSSTPPAKKPGSDKRW